MKDLNFIEKIISNYNFGLSYNKETLLTYIFNIILSIIIFIIGIVIKRVVSRNIYRLMINCQIDTTIIDFVLSLIHYFIIIFTIVVILGYIGVQTTYIFAILSAASLAIGLALQSSLANFAAGILLILFRPFRNGEYVVLNNIKGYIIKVQIFSTTLRMLDGKILITPNSKIINNNIINISRGAIRRNEWIISVSYDSDIKKVKNLLSNIINSDNRILKDKDITIRLNELSSYSINFIIRAWSKSSDLMNVYWDTLEKIKYNLDKNNIKFPYPQMDINIKFDNNINNSY